MDVPISQAPLRTRWRRPFVVGALVLAVAVTVVALFVSRVSHTPTVDVQSLQFGEVTRGHFVRTAVGGGELTPKVAERIVAEVGGRVAVLSHRVGDRVVATATIAELESSSLLLEEADARAALLAAQSARATLAARLEGEVLAKRADLAALEGEHSAATLRARADSELADQGLVSQLTKRIADLRVDELDQRRQLLQEALKRLNEAIAASLAASDAEVLQRRTLLQLRKDRIDDLHITAPTEGVIDEIAVEVGQLVEPGTLVARVVKPEELSARVRIRDTYARDLRRGLHADLETRVGPIRAVVARVSPSSEGSTVAVDLDLEGSLPPGARPHLSVVASIILEEIPDVLSVDTPVNAQPESKNRVFRLRPGATIAEATVVQFGKSSATRIEVRGGLSEGDRIVLSDTTQWSADDALRLRD